MLNVGNADAIVVQLAKNKEALTLLIDGGNGKNHNHEIIDYFEKEGIKPDLLICSHLDRDHIGGLGDILEKYHESVKQIWMHLPEARDSLLASKILVDQKTWSLCERRELICSSILDAEKFMTVADKYGLKNNIIEPFSDSPNTDFNQFCLSWSIKILGPTERFYYEQLMKFRSPYSPPAQEYASSARDCDVIGKDGPDSAENESSLIFQITANERKYLFTGDAGMRAFTKIKSQLEKNYWLKVPHHGARQNLSRGILEIIKPDVCFVSAVGDKEHPDFNLKACLIKHGVRVRCTGEENNVLVEG